MESKLYKAHNERCDVVSFRRCLQLGILTSFSTALWVCCALLISLFHVARFLMFFSN